VPRGDTWQRLRCDGFSRDENVPISKTIERSRWLLLVRARVAFSYLQSEQKDAEETRKVLGVTGGKPLA